MWGMSMAATEWRECPPDTVCIGIGDAWTAQRELYQDECGLSKAVPPSQNVHIASAESV